MLSVSFCPKVIKLSGFEFKKRLTSGSSSNNLVDSGDQPCEECGVERLRDGVSCVQGLVDVVEGRHRFARLVVPDLRHHGLRRHRLFDPDNVQLKTRIKVALR
jgi:hypothetical protein